jgi:hypothetical protein
LHVIFIISFFQFIFTGSYKFKISGTILITNCFWTLQDGSNYAHFNISGGKFTCSNMTINPFSLTGLKFVECSSGGILDCVGLKLMGANSTGNSLFVLSTGTSKFEDSV